LGGRNPPQILVMAGLDPALHVFVVVMSLRRGCPDQARA
jgi:hypothetical protein